MNSLVERGEKPEGSDNCFIECPSCHKQGNYWQTAANTIQNEKSSIFCLNCRKIIKVKGLGFNMLVIDSNE